MASWTDLALFSEVWEVVGPASGQLCAVIVFWAWMLSFLPDIISHLWSFLICPIQISTIVLFPGGKHSCSGWLPPGEGMQVRLMHPMAPGLSSLGLLSSLFPPLWASSHFSIEFPLPLMGCSFPFHTNTTYFLLLKNSSLLLDLLRSSLFGLGPREFIFSFIFFL